LILASKLGSIQKETISAGQRGVLFAMKQPKVSMFPAMCRWILPLLLVAALLAVSVLSTGCWRRDVSKAGSKVRLRIWIWGDIHETNLLTKAAKNFELDHPNVEVKVENTAGSGQKYITSLAGGDAGDVLQVHYSSLAAFADLGQLLPLEDFIKADAERGDPVGMEDFYPIDLKAYTFVTVHGL
jgi:ABC-type glycerol-3-phosphate transport system substrate-binding protein